MPLTVFSELLGCDPATPYKAARKFGLQAWLCAQVRSRLTKSAWFCLELDLERAIQFNADVLIQQARLALARRATHVSPDVDAAALAELLSVPAYQAGSVLEVWAAFVERTADRLVAVVRHGYVEDVRLAVAERYLDDLVGPRPRSLARRASAAPRTDGAPLNPAGGARRLRRILDGIGVKRSTVPGSTYASWDLMRLMYPDAVNTQDWLQEQARTRTRSIFADPSSALDISR